jgi:hypothetical protein
MTLRPKAGAVMRVAGSDSSIALMHRPQIVLGVLVIILRSNPVAIPGFSLRQREIPIVVSLGILRGLSVVAPLKLGRPGVLPLPSPHHVGFHLSVRQRLRCCSMSSYEITSLVASGDGRATFVREVGWIQSTGLAAAIEIR